MHHAQETILLHGVWGVLFHSKSLRHRSIANPTGNAARVLKLYLYFKINGRHLFTSKQFDDYDGVL